MAEQEQKKKVEIDEEEEKKELKSIIEQEENVSFDETQMFYGSGGWLPRKEVIYKWKADMLAQADKDRIDPNITLKPSVQALFTLIHSNIIINELAVKMIKEEQYEHVPTASLQNIDQMLYVISLVINYQPQFYNGHLIGVPLAALFTGANATLPGQAIFRSAIFNKVIQNVLKEWGKFLYTPQSFPKDNSWLTKDAKAKWAPPRIGMDLWIKPSEDNPYWSSWNDFFARNINRKYRPTASPDNDNVITSTNDGGFFRWRTAIKKTDTFWLKGMPYSINDILGQHLAPQYADFFVGGSIFQTFLDPFNYHRWWSPVSGTIAAVDVLPGLYYSKLVVPDYGGATTASCPYLTEVNARGIVIIDTSKTIGIGYVCCVPIGMVEVSSILYEDHIKPGAEIKKGEKLGNFAFGGSSFAIMFERVEKYRKVLEFVDCDGKRFPLNGTTSPDGDPSNPVNVGSQIAIIKDIKK